MRIAPSAVEAAVNPMQDVGVGEFLVKDGGQHLRLTLPSPPGVDPSTDALRKAQTSLELVKLRLEQVGARAPVWASCAKEVEQAERAIAGASGKLALAPKVSSGVIEEVQKLKSLVRETNLAAVNEQQVVAASALADARAALLPKGFLPFTPQPPEEFAKLPMLKGRAKVQFVLRHADPSATFTLNPDEDREGRFLEKVKDLVVEVEVDGYHAPITAGNFVKLASKGFYDNSKVDKAEELVVQTGERNSDKIKEAIPLELFYKRDPAPVYSFSSDDDARATETFVLPFQAYGALGMARLPDDADSATSQVFFVKWDQSLVPPGRNTLDGFYTCFGYAIKNAALLRQVQQGDAVVSVKVLSGLDNLVEP